jgi:glyoxylase-like metal-dependent hydrolase (beta-lactamase superfamily II)
MRIRAGPVGMALGDVAPVTAGDASDLYVLDIGMLDTPRYAAVYLVDGDRPALIETGTGANTDVILDALAELGIAPGDLEVIAPTHAHLDHAGGAGYLAEACPNAEVYVYERAARHLIDPGRLWAGTKAAVGDWVEYYAEPVPVPSDRLVELGDGDTIDLGNRDLTVHAAPGHAPHHAVFEDVTSDCVFTADAAGIYIEAFEAPRPTTPPANFDVAASLVDIEMLEALDPAGLCFSHAGAAPADGLLEAAAREIRTFVEAVEAAREAVGEDPDAIVDELEPWPDAVAVWGEQTVRETLTLNVRGVLAGQ